MVFEIIQGIPVQAYWRPSKNAKLAKNHKMFFSGGILKVICFHKKFDNTHFLSYKCKNRLKR